MKINRRTFIAGAGAAAATVGLGGFKLWAASAPKPNIVLFLADDMRYDAAGFAGNSIIKTPNIDQLARTGTVYKNHFVTTSICPTSRASIMSGQYVMQHGVNDFEASLNPASAKHIFPVIMREHGYHTGFIGKWGILDSKPAAWFDKWYGYEGQGKYFSADYPGEHLTDVQTAQAKQFLADRPVDKPFLMILAYKAAHHPMQPQKRFLKLYRDVAIPRKKSDTSEAGQQIPYIVKASNNRMLYNAVLRDDKQYQQHIKSYYRLITGLDDSMGKIIKHLKELNILSQTSIAFTSDNGMLHGEHRLGHKWVMYEESIRIPLVLRPAPAIFPQEKPRSVEKITLNIDIAPTMLAMAGAPVPAEMQGMKAWAPEGQEYPERRGFYYIAERDDKNTLVNSEGYRDTAWKYICYISLKGKKSECLFHLEKDPMELTNLAKDSAYKNKLEEMRQQTQREKKRLS